MRFWQTKTIFSVVLFAFYVLRGTNWGKNDFVEIFSNYLSFRKFHWKDSDLSESLLAGLLIVRSMCPVVHFEKYHFSEVFIDFFINFRISEKSFGHLSVKFLNFSQPYVSRVVKSEFYLSGEIFCGKKRFVNDKLSLPFLDVDRKQWLLSYKISAVLSKLHRVCPKVKIEGKHLVWKRSNDFFTFAVWAKSLGFL